MRAGYIPLGFNGIHPVVDVPNTECPFYMSEADYEDTRRDSPWMFEDLRLLRSMANLDSDGAIFKNLKRDGEENAYCYSCVPPMSVQPGVFCGFVDLPEDGGFLGPVVFWFEWREEDPDRPGFPMGWEKDFGELIWPLQ